MGEQTGIEWTDHTHNIAWGCAKVSPGCANCYADTLSHRYGYDVWGEGKPRRTFGAKHWNEPLRWDRAAEAAGERRRVFTSSMADVFEDHPTIDLQRQRLWDLIKATPNLDWQVLTKRAERIAANLPPDWGDGYPNVWLGVSVESQRFDWRAVMLCQVPAVVRFISAEPLLGPLDLTACNPVLDPAKRRRIAHRVNVLAGMPPDATSARVHWVIPGGESGPGCRPMDPRWAASLVEQCKRHDVAVFVKQLGGHPDKRGGERALIRGRRWTEMPRARALAQPLGPGH